MFLFEAFAVGLSFVFLWWIAVVRRVVKLSASPTYQVLRIFLASHAIALCLVLTLAFALIVVGGYDLWSTARNQLIGCWLLIAVVIGLWFTLGIPKSSSG